MPPTKAADRAARRSNASNARRAAVATPVEVPDIEEIDEDEVESPEDIASRMTAEAEKTNPKRPFRRPGALARPMPDLATRIDTNDIIYPKLRLSQQMSEVNRDYTRSKGKEGVAAGNWYLSTRKADLGDTVYFVPVGMRKSRALFIQGKGLICRSFDMLNGMGEPGGLCEGDSEEIATLPEEDRGCILRLWQRDGEKNTPPKCGVTYNFPGFIIDDVDEPGKTKFIPCLLQLRSTATAAAKAINTGVMDQGAGTWHHVIFELGLDERTNSLGTFYVPVAEVFELIDPDADPKGVYSRVYTYGSNVARTADAGVIRRSAEAGGED